MAGAGALPGQAGGMRSGLKAQAHAVLAKHGMAVPMSNLFGVGSRRLLAHLCATDAQFRSACGQRIESLVVLVDAFSVAIDELTDSIAHMFCDHAGYHAIQQLAGVGPVLAAIFVAEIGDVDPFASAARLASWCGVTPGHRESDTTVRRGPITKMACGAARFPGRSEEEGTACRWLVFGCASGSAHVRLSRCRQREVNSGRISPADRPVRQSLGPARPEPLVNQRTPTAVTAGR